LSKRRVLNLGLEKWYLILNIIKALENISRLIHIEIIMALHKYAEMVPALGELHDGGMDVL